MWYESLGQKHKKSFFNDTHVIDFSHVLWRFVSSKTTNIIFMWVTVNPQKSTKTFVNYNFSPLSWHRKIACCLFCNLCENFLTWKIFSATDFVHFLTLENLELKRSNVSWIAINCRYFSQPSCQNFLIDPQTNCFENIDTIQMSTSTAYNLLICAHVSVKRCLQEQFER